jgi:molecular chaperone GrpE (heat shock protein)
MTQKERLEELSEKIEKLSDNQKRILHYLENDDATNQIGVIAKMTDIEHKLDGILEREKIYKAKATVWGMVGAAVLTGLFTIGKFIIGKFA